MRVKRYKDADGQWLDVFEEQETFVIAWWDPNEGDYGLVLQNEYLDVEKEAYETNVAINVCREYFIRNDLQLPGSKRLPTFRFENKRQAKECLRLINFRLSQWTAALPEWATKALAAGWTPPKGSR